MRCASFHVEEGVNGRRGGCGSVEDEWAGESREMVRGVAFGCEDVVCAGDEGEEWGDESAIG